MLSDHQQNILQEIINTLHFSNRILIKGCAGVGKTYLLGNLVEYLREKTKNKIYCTAPTNKAVSVLQSKIKPDGKVSLLTLHKALQIRQVINETTGEVSYKPSYDREKPPLRGVDYLIVDEASMVSAELLGYLEELATKSKTTVIFSGDYRQLNPVNEQDSIVFQLTYPEFELTEIVRQKEGNPIIELSRNLENIANATSNENVSEEEGYYFSNNGKELLDKLVKSNGSNECKYLAWTNQEVVRINELVRRTIYGSPAKIELGETIVFDEPYGDGKYYTNEELKVEELKVDELSILTPDEHREVFTCYFINSDVRIIHEDSEYRYEVVRKRLRQKAKENKISWCEYYGFTGLFAKFKYNHAITVHKSQGSTYENVIVNLRDIFKNANTEERTRLLYTAITRASKLLIFCQ